MIEQTEAIRSLDVYERVSRMRLVIDGNASRKFDFLDVPTPALTRRSLDERQKIEVLMLERALQSLFDEFAVTLVGDGMSLRAAHSKDTQNDAISAGENICAQNINWNDRKRSSNFGQ